MERLIASPWALFSLFLQDPSLCRIEGVEKTIKTFWIQTWAEFSTESITQVLRSRVKVCGELVSSE